MSHLKVSAGQTARHQAVAHNAGTVIARSQSLISDNRPETLQMQRLQKNALLQANNAQRQLTNPAIIPTIQRHPRQKGDLDYGLAKRRHVAMQDAVGKGEDLREDVAPTIDHLNEMVRVTEFMKNFSYFEMLDDIRNFNKTMDSPEVKNTSGRIKHAVLWKLYLKEHINYIDIQKEVDAAIGPQQSHASKDRLLKNMTTKLGAPQKESIRAWYYEQKKPSDTNELARLENWVWNTFFRRTSKLGINFTFEIGKSIHFNVSGGIYESALAGRKSSAVHGRQAITHSELRHLKRLQDRGKAFTVHFQENDPGVKDVASPFKTLDMLSPAGVAKLLKTDEWRKEALNYETRLGVYAAKRPEAQSAVQKGLTKMDQVIGLFKNSKTGLDIENHRKVFGQNKNTSAGQIGDDPKTIKEIITGKQIGKDDDPVNHREQMTAFYNAAFWNASKGATISKVLREVGSIEDIAKRQQEAEKIGITKINIDLIHLKIKTQESKPTEEDKGEMYKEIREIYLLGKAKWEEQAKTKIGLSQEKAQAMVLQLTELEKIAVAWNKENQQKLKEGLAAQYNNELRRLAAIYAKGKVNILSSDIDHDESHNARGKRSSQDRLNHQKSSKDYTDMGAPLSSREKAAITPPNKLFNESAKLPWVEGIAYFNIDESQGWGKAMKEKGILTVAGNSGTASRLLQIYTSLGAGSLLDFRLAIMGWMLPSRDHSLSEIMQGAKANGVVGTGENLENPIEMYQKIVPLSHGDLKAHVAKDGLFPHEQVLRNVSDPVYKDLIKQ